MRFAGTEAAAVDMLEPAEMEDIVGQGGRAPASKAGGGSELGDWISKYQKSDHHADRLIRTIVQYEQTTGQRFPGRSIVVVVVVDVYSALHSATNALIVPLRRKNVSFQRLYEAVGTPIRVPE